MSEWFEDNFFTEEEEDLCLADECVCSECGESFHLPSDIDIDTCPLCGVPFDK